MAVPNRCKLVMLPPQSALTRDWAKRLADAAPEVQVVVAGDADTAAREIVDADAAFGWLQPAICWRGRESCAGFRRRRRHRPAGYYFPELIAHPLVVTNFREIFNDHISAHIMAFVLAFARGLHSTSRSSCVASGRSRRKTGGVVHLPEATALIVGLGGIGAETARLLAAFGVTVLATDARRDGAAAGRGGTASARGAGRRCCRAPISSSSPCRTRRPPRACSTAPASSA